MRQPHVGARLLAGLATVMLFTGMASVLHPVTAVAAPRPGIGVQTSPAQPYQGNPDSSDWLGSYMIGGRQVWCVQYAFLAPDNNERYEPGEPLRTKWGTALAPDVAAQISYLLLRYANTANRDEAAALAHLLHSWTAAPQNPAQLLPTNDFRHIAYDAGFHLAKMPPGARAAVERLRSDAAANHGPWTATVTAPTDPQIIGTADTWTVRVRNARGAELSGVPVTITVVDGVLEGGSATGTVPTSRDGKALDVTITPTGPNPSVEISLASPAARPVAQHAIQVDTQRVVSTGGESRLTARAATTARTAPATVVVAKVNDKTGAGIEGVSLRLTGPDRVAPAVDQEDRPIVGPDGNAAVLITAADGTVTVPNIKTPQEICVIETAPPSGYDEAFDPASPPAACGTAAPGARLAVTVANKPNAPAPPPATVTVVPIKIPAGGQVEPVALGVVERPMGPAIVSVLCGLLVAVAGAGGLLVRRRIVGRR